MTLRYYLHVVRKRWLSIIALTVLGIAVAAGLTVTMKPVYSAQATSFVRLNGASTQATTLYQNSQFALNRVVSYSEMVHSPRVLRPVIKQLGLSSTVKQLDRKVSASNPTSTVLIMVKAQDGSAARAQHIANAVSRSLANEIESLEADAGASSPVKMTLTVPAARPTSPVSPRPVLNGVLGLLIGLAIGVIVAVIREQLDTTVKSPKDLHQLSGSEPLGTIRFDPAFRTQPLVGLHKDRLGIEDFRSIRTMLQFVNVDSPPRRIVISSAVADEGKTITACNLAISMARADATVCLVDADLRRPRATAYLGIDGSVGLTEVVTGQYRLDDALVPWHRGELVVLPAGTTPPDPAQFLSSHATKVLLNELQARFDAVIIDAPPVLPVTDASVLAASADGAILVARYRHARREQLSAAIQALRAVNAELLGTVLTQIPVKARRERYGPDYEYRGGAPLSSSEAAQGTKEVEAVEGTTDMWETTPSAARVSKPTG